MKKILLSIAAGLTAASYGETLTIDLPAALKLADERNTELAVQVQNVTQAELEKSAAWYQWVPTLRIGAGYAYQDGALQETSGSVIDAERNSRYLGMGSMTAPGLAFNLDFSEAVFAPLAAKQQLRAQQFSEESIRLQVMLDVAAAYYELVRATHEVEVTREAAGHAEALAKQTADFAASGQGLQADAERAEVESLIQQQKAEMVEERKHIASYHLARLLRLEPEVALIPAHHLITPLLLVDSDTELEDLVIQALEVRPEIGQYRAEAAAEQARLKQEKYGIFFPKLEVGYSYGNFGGGTGTGNDYDDGRSDLYGMLYWEFDSLGLRNRNRMKHHQAEMTKAKAQQEQAAADIAAEVRVAHTAFKSAARQIDLAKRAVDRARKSYELNSERIFENQGLPLEALQSIRALADAESLYLATAAKYNMAQLRLLSATGNELE
ncbi:TolC family protein [Pontiella agarivorans]|uniref:TolC family protein n=1 Tax=Pontiella agarivorans TaxID=3038953 RepID=A0ABU5N175_9BACT|nr:TolC family protein [Pontiella agarivorans]MDZ8120153.1 TolC family protein [Pontiella agarivorans]